MTTTTHLGLTLVEQSQASKEVTVNTALARIDAVLNTGAKDKDLSTPPGSPLAGDVYIVAGSPTGAWSGQAKSVAYYDTAWKFIAPNEGMTLWVNDENLLYTYDGTSWTQSAPGGGGGGGGITDGDKGDITVSSSGATWTIDNGVVSLAKMANMATASFLGRNTAGSGAPEVLSISTVKSLLNLTGTNSGDQTITLTGDVTGSGTGSFAATIANQSVTYAKLQNVTSARLLGRSTAGAGSVEEISIGAGLSLSSGTLSATGGGSGTVTSVAATAPAAGFTVSGSPITASGTLTFALSDDLSAVEGLGTTGLAARTASNTWATRTLAVGTGLSISNADGVSGNPTINLAGGKQTIWIPAAAMRPSSSGGCAPLALVATTSNRPDLSTLDFDATTEEYAQFWVAMPKSWNEGTVTAQFLWSHATASTNFGVVWGLQGVAVSDADSIDTAFGTAQTVTDTGGTANNLYISAETSAITLAGSPAENDMVAFRAYRVTANGSDTLAVDARLHGVRLFFTTNAGTDD